MRSGQNSLVWQVEAAEKFPSSSALRQSAVSSGTGDVTFVTSSWKLVGGLTVKTIHHLLCSPQKSCSSVSNCCFFISCWETVNISESLNPPEFTFVATLVPWCRKKNLSFCSAFLRGQHWWRQVLWETVRPGLGLQPTPERHLQLGPGRNEQQALTERSLQSSSGVAHLF